MRWLYLLLWIVLTLAVGGISGYLTAGSVDGWYRTLVRPSFAPPNWVFGPVWTLLYLIMGIAVWLATSATTGPLRNRIIIVFLVQLSLNFLWSLIFFNRHEIGLALIEVLVMWIAIAASAWLFAQCSRIAALMMLPYLAWVTFASALNAGFWWLNRK